MQRQAPNPITRYTPREIEFISQYLLHKDAVFRSACEATVMNENPVSVKGLQFVRSHDGKIINYFDNIQDTKVDGVPSLYPTVNDFVSAYSELVKNNKINLSDITF